MWARINRTDIPKSWVHRCEGTEREKEKAVGDSKQNFREFAAAILGFYAHFSPSCESSATVKRRKSFIHITIMRHYIIEPRNEKYRMKYVTVLNSSISSIPEAHAGFWRTAAHKLNGTYRYIIIISKEIYVIF